MPSKPVVAIVGLGLVGGSLARALVGKGYRVIGVDRAAVLEKARRARAVTETRSNLLAAARVADVLVLATPPRTSVALLRRWGGRIPESLIVTDVSSVKTPIARVAREMGLGFFVGGHPMAGTEGSGFSASSANLFRGRPWVLTREGKGTPAWRRVASIVRAVGAWPVGMTVAEHDRSVAFLSHVPQVVSWALWETARRDPVAVRYLRVAGPGFHDMTRLAASPRALWHEILRLNHREVSRALDALRRALDKQ